MPYVQRDENGNIIGIFENPQEFAQEYIEGDVKLHDMTPLKDILKNYRKEFQDNGFQINGMDILTDVESTSVLTALRILAKEDSQYTVKWKTPNGFVTLDAQTIIYIADMAREYVQLCFDAEAYVTDLIDNNSVTSKEQVITEFEKYMGDNS